MGGNGRHRWFSFHHRSASASEPPPQTQKAPPEFLCPISGFLMSDPVVVASGQTFERISVQVCRNLGFVPELDDGTRPDFSTVIPNLAMKSTILSWCDHSGSEQPRPPEYAFVEGVVRGRIEAGSGIQISLRSRLPSVTENLPVTDYNDDDAFRKRFRNFDSSSSIESLSVDPVTSPYNPTRPGGFSSTSSSSSSGVFPEAGASIQIPNSFSSESSSSPPISPEEEEIFNKLKSPDIFDHEQGLILLRKMTRSNQEARVSLCTDRILSFLKSLVASRYSMVQINAAASVVNLSLEKQNKVKIVRSGFVPLLIDVLKSGSSEAQEHAAGALFSLALEDENKMVIGVLGALQPLLHAVRAAESDRARQDAAIALYHLSLIASNRSKLVRLSAVPALLSIIRSNESAASSRVLLVLCNLAACPEGKAAMLDGDAVGILLGKLREGNCESESARENCVAALLALSQGNMRFKGVAKEAGAEELLKEVEEKGSQRAKEKAAKILQIMRREEGGREGGEAREWERMIEASGLSQTQYQAGQNGGKFAISSQF